jgi:transcriptional regulator with XRE-family HTH domain
MGSPLGDFLRARRDGTAPGAVGLPAGGRRRAPGLRRSELAALAGISVEYLVRIEQGRDRNPSPAVVNALAGALRLDAAGREHLRHLTKITGGTCVGARVQPGRQVRPGARRLLDSLEPGVAVISNRLGDLLAYTSGFEAVARRAGLLDGDRPNLTRFVFTDPRARQVFPDWDRIADEQAYALSCSPADDYSAGFRSGLAALAGKPFTRRLQGHPLPAGGTPLRWTLPALGELRWDREILQLPPADAQQLTVFLPADQPTGEAVARVLRAGGTVLRVVN